MQSRYWKMMCDFRFSYFYYDALMNSSFNWNRIVKIIVAVFSAGSVASWKIWEIYADAWAWVVVLSQIVILANEFFPFSNRADSLKKALPFFADICSLVENHWNDVQQGRLSNDQLNDIITMVQDEWTTVKETYLCNDSLPDHAGLREKAEALMLKHMKQYKGVQ